ncbi:hypothetical protein KY289_027144 [Solanum tuberosum]|nr:hypothetical protein KY289_027144 [Solanum tuberosum]KAH0662032.1 hypothetical protein KY284_026963 [Solanum tuberosum]
MTKDPVFDAMSYKTTSPYFQYDPNASVLDAVQSALVITKVTDKSICGNDSLHPEATIQVLHECSHNIKLRSIAPRVSLLVPFDGPAVVRSNEHLEQDMSTRQASILRLDVNTSLDCKTEIYYTMCARKNHFALFSSTIGLQNLHARFNVLSIGITDPVIFFGKHSVEHVVLSMSAITGPSRFVSMDFSLTCLLEEIVGLSILLLMMFYQDNASFMYNLIFGEGQLKDILYLSSLEFILFVIKRFIEKFPQDERYFLTVVDQAKFPKLLDDMEQVASNLKSAHFKDNLKHLHYISLLQLVYFVGSSTRIVRPFKQMGF